MKKNPYFDIGTTIHIIYTKDSKQFDIFFIIQECFIDGFACIATQISGKNAGWTNLISNSCSVEKTDVSHPTMIRELFELEIKQLLGATVLQSVQYFSQRLDAQAVAANLLSYETKCEGYGLGTIFVITDYYDGQEEREAWLLARSTDPNYWFHIVQISGLHAGFSAGYVKRYDHQMKLTITELWNEILYNFVAPKQETLVVFQDGFSCLPLNELDLR